MSAERAERPSRDGQSRGRKTRPAEPRTDRVRGAGRGHGPCAIFLPVLWHGVPCGVAVPGTAWPLYRSWTLAAIRGQDNGGDRKTCPDWPLGGEGIPWPAGAARGGGASVANVQSLVRAADFLDKSAEGFPRTHAVMAAVRGYLHSLAVLASSGHPPDSKRSWAVDLLAGDRSTLSPLERLFLLFQLAVASSLDLKLEGSPGLQQNDIYPTAREYYMVELEAAPLPPRARDNVFISGTTFFPFSSLGRAMFLI